MVAKGRSRSFRFSEGNLAYFQGQTSCEFFQGGHIIIDTLLGTSLPETLLKIIFLFPRLGFVPRRVNCIYKHGFLSGGIFSFININSKNLGELITQWCSLHQPNCLGRNVRIPLDINRYSCLVCDISLIRPHFEREQHFC